MTKIYSTILIAVAFILGIAFSVIPVDHARAEYADIAVRFARFFEATISTLVMIALVKYIVRD